MQFERAAAILRGVEQAPTFGVAAPVPADDLLAADAHQAFPQSRIRAARSWLFALGYLAMDEDRADYDPALQSAVTRFQQEAGLVVDGWIGAHQTWPRLQALVTFEAALDPAHWSQPDGSPRPALVRAVRLRLSVYGIGKIEAGVDLTDLTRDLATFDKLLRDLGVDAAQSTPRLAESLVHVLDHDVHLGSIVASAGASKVRRLLEELDDGDRAVAAFGLLLNIAKVELWLAQEAEVDLKTVYRSRLRFGRDLVLPREIRLDMVQYMSWVDEEAHGVSGLRKAFQRAIRADEPYQAVRLFLQTAANHGQVSEPFAEDRLELLDAFYGGQANDVPRRAEETVNALTGQASFRSRLWDGLRRLWSWMNKALRRAIATGKKVLKLARDLAAYAFQAASEGLRQILHAIGAFVRHAETAASRSHVDPRGWVGVRRELGRDVNLFVSPGAASGYVEVWTERLATSAAIFRRASSVLRYVIALGLAVSGLVVGGPLVLRSLLQVARDLRRVVSVLGEISRLQTRHDELDQILARA
ncbi:MAG: peptidoglycan-binding protein [Paracoccaceae bacterium]